MDLSNLLGGKTTNELLADLLDDKNIFMKTRVNIGQIKTIVILRWHIELSLKKNEGVDPMLLLMNVIDYYLGLLVSLNSESRKEIVDAIIGKGMVEEKTEGVKIK